MASFQPVTLIVGKERAGDVTSRLNSIDTIFPIALRYTEGDSMDTWLKDFGPTFVLREPGGESSLVSVDSNPNDGSHKNHTPTSIALSKTYLQDLQVQRIPSSIVTEGGALETDGEGTLILTESSIINENRNSNKSRQDIEAELKRTLGVQKFIWIPGGKPVNSTDCQIDALVRFVRPGVVLLSRANERTPTDWTATYREARRALLGATDAKGRQLEVHEVEEPSEDVLPPTTPDHGKSRAVRSYVNYLLFDGGIIVPQFGDPLRDAEAVRTAETLFGGERKVLPVLIEELPILGGDTYCAAQDP
ncbi:Agmatine deiminase [Cladobotryum mycophilum]|uniref:Agmatine deiminase n=1 Tax=Cladobotryum mycophilum TaxID=491253 RepID=A0ABR0SEW3_9HYPO